MSSENPPSSNAANVIVTGANIENASYPVCLCAERVALSSAIAQGHFVPPAPAPAPSSAAAAPAPAPAPRPSTGTIRAVAVATDQRVPCSPCGMCRQFLAEFCAGDVLVLLVVAPAAATAPAPTDATRAKEQDRGGAIQAVALTLAELLPWGFGGAIVRAAVAEGEMHGGA